MYQIHLIRAWLEDGTLKQVSPLHIGPGMVIRDAELFARKILTDSEGKSQVLIAANSRAKLLVENVENVIEGKESRDT